jgi:hypothetical protein
MFDSENSKAQLANVKAKKAKEAKKRKEVDEGGSAAAGPR